MDALGISFGPISDLLSRAVVLGDDTTTSQSVF